MNHLIQPDVYITCCLVAEDCFLLGLTFVCYFTDHLNAIKSSMEVLIKFKDLALLAIWPYLHYLELEFLIMRSCLSYQKCLYEKFY